MNCNYYNIVQKLPSIECNDYLPKHIINTVFHNPETKDVYDEHKNHIGKGEFIDGILKITRDEKVS